MVGLRAHSMRVAQNFFTGQTSATQSSAKRSFASNISYEGRYRYRRSPNENYVVGSTIALCCSVFLYTKSLEMRRTEARDYSKLRSYINTVQTFRENFVLSRQNLQEGRWWTLVTSIFTHTQPIHLLFNMVFLWGVGRQFVFIYGAGAYALVWLASGVGGGAVQAYWPEIMNKLVKVGIIKKSFWLEPDKEAVGASGSLFGLFAGLACTFPRSSYPVQATLWAGVSILCLSTDSLPWLGHKAHLGGMAIGAAVWVIGLRRGRGIF